MPGDTSSSCPDKMKGKGTPSKFILACTLTCVDGLWTAFCVASV